MAFDLEISPDKQNYVTACFWGDDVNSNKLLLFVEGKQVGYRHLGDIEILDLGADAPEYNGRFVCRTLPLPESLTRGKSKVRCEIMANGPIWGYGQTFDKYQKPMQEPSRGIYSASTHLDPLFVPPASYVQGVNLADPPVRTQPGAEVFEAAKGRVTRELNKILQDARAPGQMQVQFLARAWHVGWTPARSNPKVVERVVQGIDDFYVRSRKDPKLITSDPSTPNPDWFGTGPIGHAIALLPEQLGPRLDEEIPDGNGGMIRRRAAWAELLQSSRDWNERNRRAYTNQSMIKDLNIYLANRGLQVVDPAKAKPEEEMIAYLKESVGLSPWLGSLTDAGPERPLGNNYMQLTPKGLTKELGYVGNYGEVIDWVSQIYNATRTSPSEPGNAEIRDQLIRIARARAIFRYPMLDAEGFRAMRLESYIGWRDTHFPGDVVYAQRTTWDGSTVEATAATLDPELVGYVQQMFADNQFFATLAHQVEEKGFRSTCALLSIPEDYEKLKAQPPQSARLPMAPGQPDFAWTDEENGVVAVKNGDEILYASLYWRARHGLNFLAKVHYMVPEFQRTAIVRQECQYDAYGQDYARKDWVDAGFANGRFKYPDSPGSAHAGEKLPIAKVPADVKFKPGDENIHAGRATFYTLRYGPYLVAMNTTKDRTFELVVPEDWRGRSARELVGRSIIDLSDKLTVSPFSTVIVYLPYGEG